MTPLLAAEVTVSVGIVGLLAVAAFACAIFGKLQPAVLCLSVAVAVLVMR